MTKEERIIEEKLGVSLKHGENPSTNDVSLLGDQIFEDDEAGDEKGEYVKMMFSREEYLKKEDELE